MSKVDVIKNQLAQRLEKQAERTPPAAPVAAERPQASTPATQRAAARQASQKADRTKTDSQQAEVREGVIKVSASLYSFDIDCLDRIREFMRGKGVRNVTDSEALRLACRAVKIDDGLMGIYEEMSKEDRRRRKQ